MPIHTICDFKELIYKYIKNTKTNNMQIAPKDSLSSVNAEISKARTIKIENAAGIVYLT